MLKVQYLRFIAIIILNCLLVPPVLAQNIQNDVISCSGEACKNSSASLQWTLGECIIESFSNSEYSLTQGFHQIYFKLTSLSNKRIAPGDIKVYPNPASDYLYIKLPDNNKTASVKILDLNGKLVYLNLNYISETKLNLNSFSLSTYILNVYLEDNISESFKIEKITF